MKAQAFNSATRNVRVNRKSTEAVDICSFELVDAAGNVLPPFSAGSHIDVHVGNGLVRQYSLCNDPAETHRYLSAVLRDPGSRGGSTGMHSLEVVQPIRFSDPKNHFALAHDARHSVLIAGGIGVTPILCMAERLANATSKVERAYRSPCARSCCNSP